MTIQSDDDSETATRRDEGIQCELISPELQRKESVVRQLSQHDLTRTAGRNITVPWS